MVSDAIGIPIMIQDAPVAGTPLSVDFLARMAQGARQCRLLQDRGADGGQQAARPDREGRQRDRGPWDGEEAITLMADLDAGATGAMTGGGYPDGIRQIMDPFFAGKRDEAVAAYAALAAADQLREPAMRPVGLQGADARGRRHQVGRGAPPAAAAAPGDTRRADRDCEIARSGRAALGAVSGSFSAGMYKLWPWSAHERSHRADFSRLPNSDQEQIGRVLSHVEKLTALRIEIDKGIGSLDEGRGTALNIEDFLREKNAGHGGT